MSTTTARGGGAVTGEDQPLAIDLYCGLGGWTEGLLAEGYRVIGFDIERHVYGAHRYPAQLVLQDVRTIHGRQFAGASLIVASPPCQAFSYMAMPWTRAKQMIRDYEDGTRDRGELTALFDACFRLQWEASEAAGRHIPLVVENVRGAQRWVGKAAWHHGSFYLWGDVPALMPDASNRGAVKVGCDGLTNEYGRTSGKFHSGGLAAGKLKQLADEGVKVPTMGAGWYPPNHPKHQPGLAFNGHAERYTKACFASRDCDKGGGDWFGAGDDCSLQRRASSKSSARKFASALIAKIPLALSRHIAAVYRESAVRQAVYS